MSVNLSDEQIAEFQRLYKARYGVDISRDEAIERGTKLIELIRWVYKPCAKAEGEVAVKETSVTLSKERQGTNMTDRLMTVKDLCEYLKIGENTVRNWIRTSQIPHYKVGRLVRFDLQEIKTWMKRRTAD